MRNDPEIHDSHDDDDEGRVSAPHKNPSSTKAPTNVRTYPMSSMRISREGLAFITSVEGNGHDTDGVQWPAAGSGVTVGLGYDLHGHTPREIVSDLTSIGIDRKKAEFLATAQTFTDNKAKDFAKDNKNLITLTNFQKQALLQKTIEKYENDLKKVADFPVTQYQYDALVALAYNPGGPISVITRSIASGNFAQAEKDWLSRSHSRSHSHSHSKVQPMGGLVIRRNREVKLYKTGIYN